jgi:hypothetical protein
MTVLKGLAEFVGRIAHLIVPPAEPMLPLTEDDVRTDQYLRQRASR